MRKHASACVHRTRCHRYVSTPHGLSCRGGRLSRVSGEGSSRLRWWSTWDARRGRFQHLGDSLACSSYRTLATLTVFLGAISWEPFGTGVKPRPATGTYCLPSSTACQAPSGDACQRPGSDLGAGGCRFESGHPNRFRAYVDLDVAQYGSQAGSLARQGIQTERSWAK